MQNKNLTDDEISNCKQQLNSALLSFENSKNVIEYDAAGQKITVQAFEGIGAYNLYVAGYDNENRLVDVLRIDMSKLQEEYQSFDVSQVTSKTEDIKIFLFGQALMPYSLSISE